jgi:hypothetical protein
VRGDLRGPLRGTAAQLASAVGVKAEAPAAVYTDHAELGPDDELQADPVAAGLVLDWFARGDRALRQFAPGATPVLWPEHLDLGIALDEVNYGVPPGDRDHPLPYRSGRGRAPVTPLTPAVHPGEARCFA